MEQKIPFGPSWARAKWDLLLHLEKRPDSHGTPLPRTTAAGIPPGVPCAAAPPARFVSGTRERKGALLSEGPLGGLEAKPGFEPGVKALQASALPLGHFAEKGPLETVRKCNGADNGARTRDPNLGKVVLYQLSHVRLRVINIRDAAGGRKEFFKDC